MPRRTPGPLCASTAQAIDKGTNCRHASPQPGPIGISLRQQAAPITFGRLWASYPGEHPYVDAKGNTPAGFDNQCAIKLSAALVAAGVPFETFKGASVPVKGSRLAVRAEELAAWLRTEAPALLRSRRRTITGSDWQAKIAGQTGIVFFQDYWLRSGEKQPSGDHIDLWNGSRLTASGLAGSVVTTLRFTFGINSGPGFSDLGAARRIEFWGVA